MKALGLQEHTCKGNLISMQWCVVHAVFPRALVKGDAASS